MKKVFIIGGIFVAILITVVLWKKSSGDAGIRVTTEKAAARNVTESVSASGKVQPEVEVKISSDVSGEIVELFVKEGDTVKKGDLLLRVNPDLYQSAVDRMQATLNSSKANLSNSMARLEQSKAQYTNAEAAFNRNKKLHDQGAVSDAEFDQSKATYESAKADVAAAAESVKSAEFNINSTQASLKEASDNLARTTIFAPVSGTVSKLNKRKGERVVGTAQMEGTEILRLANLNEMQVQVDVNENDILRVHLGDTALVEVDAHNNRKFKGVVTEVANSATTTGITTDQVTNFQVKIRILRESYLDLVDPLHPERYVFLPGMSATVEIQTKSVYQVVTVPIQAVTTRPDSAAKADAPKASKDEQGKAKNDAVMEVVFVYRDGVAKQVQVVTGVQDNMYIEIKEGLKTGDEVITAPFNAVRSKLANDMKVEKVDKKDLSKLDI
jgi:HlyD family secretion protein